jgi:putative transposase
MAILRRDHPYLLHQLNIIRPNKVRGVDITYLRMKKGFMYLFVIIDWYSRLYICLIL